MTASSQESETKRNVGVVGGRDWAAVITKVFRKSLTEKGHLNGDLQEVRE